METETYTTTLDAGSFKGYGEAIVADGATGEAIVLARKVATIALHPAEGGSGKIQYTTSLPSKVQSNNARWIDWKAGVVSESTASVVDGPVTAIRGVSVAGQLVIELIR
jgi:hypothetical protein